MNMINVEIVTPERIVYSGEARAVVASGVEGSIGVLANHVPLVTPLEIAPVQVKKPSGEDLLAVSGGFMEVRKDKVTILATTAELPEDIDVTRAQASKERAERRLQQANRDSLDIKRAQLALQRALIRLQVAAKAVKTN
ncbi:F0F1 ATP synthase subunit epsilon [Ammoniphilus oxalaticus]|uniref:ATP synthase epsilon chain n=1 Tax=Ammoniphilus oxalaticus TaxID=66863 RepID=A0A419SH12_9BACL|nr:F0F1 ATP synthase subunit epsilon [Ammoniphilus oxalaticus]RKD23070.1 F0F1 ATP synthase subunit epsilon [Ammoniphilus oxalaticus]